MRKHTKEFKSSISTFGRELDSKITVLGTELILEKEDLFSITPITNSTLLKTVMKEVDFESKKQIGIGQEINVKSGVKVNGEYEYIDYGNYSVYKSEYKAETDTYSHICYDKMLKTMIDYTPLDITYPINLREYITAIATKCGLEFADKNSAFANYNTSINEDHFSNGNYTFRDVLDYIAQLVGGWLCINDNDELEIRYPSQAKNYESDSGEEINFYTEVEDKIKELTIDGKSTQATRSGKNKANIKNYSNTINGVTLTINNGEITLNGTATGDFEFTNVGEFLYKAGKSYSGTFIYSSGSCTDYGAGIYLANSPTSNINIGGGASFRTNQSRIFNINSKTEDLQEYFYVKGYKESVYTNYKVKVQIVEGTTADYDYEPYGVMPSPDYPSEIESVGTYFSFDEETGKYGIEVKNTGKNLLNLPDGTYTNKGITAVISNGVITINGISTETSFISIPINLELASIFSISLNNTAMGDSLSEVRLQISGSDFRSVSLSVANNKRENLSKYGTYKSLMIRISSGVTITNGIIKPQVELGYTSDYEPYQSTSSLFVLDQPLRSLPNGVKDIAYIKNNILYVDRHVGTVVLNGSERWTHLQYGTSGQYYYQYVPSGLGQQTQDGKLIYCNYFVAKSQWSARTQGIWFDKNMIITTTGSLSGTETLDEFKTWLSTHNTQVDYELSEPYTETIGEVETLSTFKGVNNVSLDANMQTNMTITYPTEYEELDKHFLKDVNVSFSKKYGAVNSVVFSRGNGSDNIYRKDNASINKNGLTEIKIADNPFLEGDDRENFIQQLFDKINGLEFYIMDVSSTGIMYLELGDLYYFNMVEEKPSLKSGLVKSGMRKAQGSSGGKFLCLLMNDEIKITRGLEESIYSDEPEITETDYKTASITDTSIKNAIIQTNKNSAEILLKVNSDEVVSAINLSPENIKISSAKLDIDAIATFTNSKLAEAGSTVINGANITTGSISCDRLNGGTINGQKISGSTISGGSISIQKGVYYFNMGTSTSNPNCSGLNVGSYGVKAHSDITATGFAITDSDTGKSGTFILRHSNGTSVVYLTFTGGILTAYDQLD